MTYITKKHLSRRTMLRGLGAALALPVLDSMTSNLLVALGDSPERAAQSARSAAPAR